MTFSAKLTLVSFAVLAACAPTPGSTHADEAAAQAPAPTNRLDIPVTVRRNLGITFAEVELRHVEQTIRIPGAFELQPRARHEYRMALPGRVQILVDQYERVEAGQPLFRYQSPAWPELLHEIILGEQAMDTAQAEINVGLAKLDEVRQRLERMRSRVAALAEADFKHAELELQAAELEASVPRLGAELRLAETRFANAERTRQHALHRAATAADIPEEELAAEVLVGDERVPTFLTIDWIDVRAVEAGVVESLSITDGAFAEPPATILATVDPERVRFRALALQADLPALSRASGARVVPPAAPGIPIAERVETTFTIGLEAHPRERTITLLATPLERAEWVRPGVSAFLEVVVASTQAPALAVPTSAVVRDGLRHVLFRRDPGDPNKAIRIEADLGTSDGRWTVLNSGVMRGDEVVVAGAYELKIAADDSSSSQIGGHVHADGSFHDDH
jgi:hypothetical protein